MSKLSANNRKLVIATSIIILIGVIVLIGLSIGRGDGVPTVAPPLIIVAAIGLIIGSRK